MGKLTWLSFLAFELTWFAQAQLPYARLNSVFPPGGQIGTTNEITIVGADLDGPGRLHFSDSRLVALPNTSNSSSFSVVIPPEVAPGLVDVRWVGRFGASNPRTFALGETPERVAPSTNATPDAAFELPRDTVINGRTSANQVSWFRFEAQAGERLLVALQTRELDSRLDPMLRFGDATGRTLRQSRRGLIDFVAPTNGSYRLQVHDTTYRGGEEFVYRLALTSAPRVDFALPNILQRGATNHVTLFGRNFPESRRSSLTGPDGQPFDELDVEILAPAASSELAIEHLPKPASAFLAGDHWVWRFRVTNGVSNPLHFALTTNAVWATATNGLVRVNPPGEFCGLFPRRGEHSGVTFEAKKGDVLWLEVFADRLGWPCDPSVVVQRERRTKGEAGETLYADVLELSDTDANLGGLDFNTFSRDASGRFAAPEDGTYRVLIRDLFHYGPQSAQYPYRLSLRRESPDFSLVAAPVQPVRQNDNDRNVHPITPFLRQGETMPVKVMAMRRDGFSGEVELSVTNLPTGVTASTTGIPAGQNTGWLLLTASEISADSRIAPWHMIGRAKIAEVESTRTTPLATVVNHVPDSNEQAIAARLAREPLLSVSSVEWAPISIVPVEDKVWEATTNGKLVLNVQVIRRGDFNGAISLKPAGRPELDKLKPVSVPEKATNATLEFELAEAKLPEGKSTWWLQGTIAGKYRNNPEALAEAEADLKAAEQALAATTESEKPALEMRKKQAEERRKTAEERAKPREVTWMVYSRPFEVKLSSATNAPAGAP